MHETSEKCFFLRKCSNRLCQFQHSSSKNVEETQKPENPKGFTVIRKKQVVYKCAICEFRANDMEVVRNHAPEKHRGNRLDKEKVNVTRVDNNGDIDKENEENNEDVHDSVSAYLKNIEERRMNLKNCNPAK